MKKADPGYQSGSAFCFVQLPYKSTPSDASNIGNPCVTRWGALLFCSRTQLRAGNGFLPKNRTTRVRRSLAFFVDTFYTKWTGLSSTYRAKSRLKMRVLRGQLSPKNNLCYAGSIGSNYPQSRQESPLNGAGVSLDFQRLYRISTGERPLNKTSKRKIGVSLSPVRLGETSLRGRLAISNRVHFMADLSTERNGSTTVRQ